MDNIERRDREMAYISDDAVFQEQLVCRRILQKLNFMDRADFDGIRAVVKELLGKSENAFINPPFYCDYGSHIEVGKNFFANYNCCIIDVAKVTIGDHCQMAPNVAIYTAGHPIHPDSRNSLYEYGKAVTIGDNVWIGGNTVICPGVTIGSNTVIGAGSVVTHDIPEWTVAAGNPCRVLRRITEADRRKLYKNEMIDDEAWADIVSKGWGKSHTVDKKALRREISAKKNALTPLEVSRRSAVLAQRLYETAQYRDCRSLYAYLSFNQEVRTDPIIERAWADGKRVAVPKIIGKEMVFIWIDSFEGLAPQGAYNITEPIENGPVADDETALILMPGLAFDPEGRRVGYGGGYYDRYLEKEPQHPLVALCYDFQFLPHLDTDPHDIPVDLVITDK